MEVAENVSNTKQKPLFFFSKKYQPLKSYSGDAGYDLKSTKDVIIPANDRMIIDTETRYLLPQGFYLQIRDRSSLALKGIIVSGGICDNNFRGSIKICLNNTTEVDYIVHDGDKIAQAIISRDYSDVFQIEYLSDPEQLNDYKRIIFYNGSARGESEFGSSDTK